MTTPPVPVQSILDMAASAAQQQGGQGPASIQPGNQPQQSLTSFGPQPLVQPPPQPRMQQQPSQNEKTTFNSVGDRKRSDMKALTGSVANAIKSGADYVNAKKTRTLQMNIERLMGAQQGMQEAQQTLKQNPNDPEAKKALETNTGIINDITKDPKMNKQLQKAFNVDLFGNGKNKQENQALIAAHQEFQKKQQAGDKTALNPVAQKLMASQPQRQQINPQLQLQAQMIKDKILPAANEILKSRWENDRTLAIAQSSEDRTAAMNEHNNILEKNAKLIAGTRDAQTAAYISRTTLQGVSEKDRITVMNRVADLRHTDTAMRINAMEQIATGKDNVQMERIKALENIAKDKNKTMQDKNAALSELNKIRMGQTILGSMAKQLTSYNNTSKTLKDQNVKLQAEIDKKGSGVWGWKMSAADEASIRQMKNTITTNMRMMDTIEGQKSEINKKMDQMQSAGIIGAIKLSSEPSDVGQEDPERLFPTTDGDDE